MDVDSPSVIPGTPDVDDYASLGEGDDLSRRTTPAFLESEHTELKHGEGSNSNGASENEERQQAYSAPSGISAPAVAYEMDLDNNDDEQLEVQQVSARRTVSWPTCSRKARIRLNSALYRNERALLRQVSTLRPARKAQSGNMELQLSIHAVLLQHQHQRRLKIQGRLRWHLSWCHQISQASSQRATILSTGRTIAILLADLLRPTAKH